MRFRGNLAQAIIAPHPLRASLGATAKVALALIAAQPLLLQEAPRYLLHSAVQSLAAQTVAKAATLLTASAAPALLPSLNLRVGDWSFYAAPVFCTGSWYTYILQCLRAAVAALFLLDLARGSLDSDAFVVSWFLAL